MNNFDYVILGIIGLSTIIAVWRGFIKELISLISLSLAFIVAGQTSSLASDFLSEWITQDDVANIAGFALVFIGVLMLGAIISFIIYKVINMAELSMLDRILGIFFGLTRGILFVSIGFLAYLSMYEDGRHVSWLKGSLLTPYAIELSEILGKSIPEGYPLSRQKKSIFSSGINITDDLQDLSKSIKEQIK
ncbi:MAG: CvpA family protein [Mariprofundaceae bacterium]|nr:CvpA family protein [Mariprofundaceae bacterium]